MIANSNEVVFQKIQDVVDSFCDIQGNLFTQRRELVVSLFEEAGIKSSKQFDESKNYIKLAYTANFAKTSFYKAIVSKEFRFNDRLFQCDKHFYEEGLILTRGLKKRKQTGSFIS